MTEVEDHGQVVEDDGAPEMIWRLILTVSGRDYRDVVILESEDQDDLVPDLMYGNDQAVLYQRYRGDKPDEYLEIRDDYVIMRQLSYEPVVAPTEQFMVDQQSNYIDDLTSILPPELRLR